MSELWVEKYRPSKVEDYVWRDADMKATVESWIKNKNIPTLLLSGSPGVGKTTLARMLLKEMDVNPGDIIEINASRERKVDDVQDAVLNFASTWPIGDFKYIILDECLEENEEIQLANDLTIKLKDMEDFKEYYVKSINRETGEIEVDVASVISRTLDEIYEVELEDGTKVRCNEQHPFLIHTESGISEKRLVDLVSGDRIITIDGEVKIKTITSVGEGTVVGITVHKNHTYFTKSGIANKNCDSLSPLAQRMLRAEIEKYSDSCRFIFSANHRNKIIPAIQSRCQTFHIESLDRNEFMTRIVNILLEEKVEIENDDIKTIDHIITMTYPDLRKCINLTQQSVVDGKLLKPSNDDGADLDYLISMVDLFKQGKYLEARKLLVAQAQPEEYEDIFRWFYQNLEIWGDEAKQNEALLIIRKGLVNHALVADVEINMSAMIVELCALLE